MRQIMFAMLVVPFSANGDVLEVPGQYATIQLAADAASPGDEIVVSPGSHAGFESLIELSIRGLGEHPESTTVTGLIEAVDQLSLSNLKLSGGLNSKGFEQITIEKCVVVSQGIVVQNSVVEISDTRFEGCEGGAVLVADGTASITNCQFVNNSTTQSGGAISCSDSTLIVEDCEFAGNHADGNGGAIEANTFAAELEIRGSLFVGNSAGNGGAVYNSVQFGACEIDCSEFHENSAIAGAAAVWMQGGGSSAPPGSIDDTVFEHNTTTDLSGAAVVAVLGVLQPPPAVSNSRFCGSIPGDISGKFSDSGGNTFRVECECLADTNGDGELSPADFSAWVSAFNTMSPACDQNADSLCNPADFSAWVTSYNAGCP